MNNFTVNIRQSIVTSAMAVSKPGVIDAEEMENGGVEVVDMDAVLRNFRADFVGAAVSLAGLDSSAREPA